MLVTSKIRYSRISPKKVRLLANTVKNKNAGVADAELKLINKKAASIISRAIRAAMADAENNFNLKKDSLIVKRLEIDQGPSYKRFSPRARGSASPILKRTSHIAVVLEGTEFLTSAPKKAADIVDVKWEEIEKEAVEKKSAKASVVTKKEEEKKDTDTKVEKSVKHAKKTVVHKAKKEEAVTEQEPVAEEEIVSEKPKFEPKKESWSESVGQKGKDFVKRFFRRKSG